MAKVTAKMENGNIYEAANCVQLVKMLKMEMYFDQTKQEYMAETAMRCQYFNGNEIQYSNAEEFIKELRRIGVITELMILE